MRRFSQNVATHGRLSPVCTLGWQAADPRTRSGLAVGNALLDGNYRTSWEHFHVAVRQAMTSSLAYLKGGQDALPRGLMLPMATDGRFLKQYTRDTIINSFEQVQQGSLLPLTPDPIPETVFHRTYDVLCPLPSSKGPASPPNVEIATVMAKAWSLSPPILNLIVRHSPLAVKSTETDRLTRMNKDAPRLMHMDTLSVDKTYAREVRGMKILLYDDVFTWGNTSEAARNLLLLLGAAEVDVLTCFATGPMYRSACYELVNASAEAAILTPETVSKEFFALRKSSLHEKEFLRWKEQESFKTWHERALAYIKKNFPEFIPNDIPWM